MAASSDSTLLASQVGGHKGIQSTADGSLIIKPCLPAEGEFYTRLSTSADFAYLRPFIPRFIGVLRLEGSVELDESGSVKTGEVKQIPDESGQESIVLENLAFPFNKPNIIDIKLGTVLFDQDASAEKRERMEKAARATTSHETGIRLTGFQVWDPITQSTTTIPKACGKSITKADLPEGIRRFFPTGSVPSNLLGRVIDGIAQRVGDIKAAVEATEMRMVGGSLLVIWEGDGNTLEEAFEAWDARGGMDVDEEEDEEDEDESGEGAGAETDEEGSSSPKKLGPPFLVKLIDFAHTRFTPGEGPDEGVVTGLSTTLNLLEGRLKEIQEAA